MRNLVNPKVLWAATGIMLPLAAYAQAQSSVLTWEWFGGILLVLVGALVSKAYTSLTSQVKENTRGLAEQEKKLHSLENKMGTEYHDINDIKELIAPINDTLKEHGEMLRKIMIEVAVLQQNPKISRHS